MAVIKCKDLNWDGQKLKIIFEESELEKIVDGTELVFIDRESRESFNLQFSLDEIRKTKTLIIDFKSIGLNNFNEQKNILDLVFKTKDESYKIIYNEKLKLDKSLRYLEPAYSLNDNIKAIAYLTIKNEISILIGDNRSVLYTYCNQINDKLSIDSLKVDGNNIIFTMKEFDITKYDENYFIIKDVNSKDEYNLDFKISNSNNLSQIIVDLSQVKLKADGENYELFFENVTGRIIKRNRIGFFNTSHDEIKKYFEQAICNSNTNIIPFAADDGGAVICITSEELRDTCTITDNKFLIENLYLENRIFFVKFSKINKESFSSLERVKIVFGNTENSDAVGLEIDREKFVNEGCICIDTSRLSTNEKINTKGRWKLYIRLYYKEETTISLLVKDSIGLDSTKNRYTEPVSFENNLVGVFNVNDRNELSFVCTDIQGFRNEAYMLVESSENISEYEVEGNVLSFKISSKINKSLVRNITAVLIERDEKETYYIPLNYDEVTKTGKVEVDFADFINLNGETASRWDFYLEFLYDSFIDRRKLGNYKEVISENYKRYMRRFEKMGGTENVVVPYLSLKNELSIVVKKERPYYNEKYKSRVEITKVSVGKNTINMKVQLEMAEVSHYKVERVALVFRNKLEKKEISLIAPELNIDGFRRNIRVNIDLDKCELEQLFWDIFIVIDVDGEDVYVKVRSPRPSVKRKLNNKIFGNSCTINNEFIVYPYVTNDNAVAIAYRNKGEFETNKYKLNEVIALAIYRLFKFYLNRKDIWLVYEKFSETAQDNSYYFFKYCYNNQPNKQVYYIMKKDSPDYPNLKGMEGRVLDFMSIKHLIYLCAAKVLVSSESKTHGYAWRVQQGKIKQILDSKKHAFLQHGVTALKRVDYVFSKKAKTAVDLFVVTSEYERKIIKDNFGYNDDEIITTGFCRWDELIDKSNELKSKEIFLMPTWRNWLDEVSEDKFVQTPYFKNYMALLNSKKLQKILKKNNIKMNFYIHPKFKYYIDSFSASSKNVNIIQFGEQKVNELLMKTSLLITDYSSVSWDVYYQKKPVIFYQFDYDDYNAYQGSYLDMETELFGDRVFNADDLVKIIEDYVKNNFKEKQEFADMRQKYFKYVDTNNSERAFESIKNSKVLKRNKANSVKTDTTLAKYRRIRSNKIVKLMWNAARKNEATARFAKKVKSLVRRITIQR